jgi:hypothetical protein
MFIAGPLTQTLLNEYGLQGTFLILAAVASNIIVAGALMRPSDLVGRCKRRIENPMFHIQYCKQQQIKDLFNKMSTCRMFFTLFANLLLLLYDISSMLCFIGSTFGRILTGVAIGNNGIDPVLLNFGLNGLVGLLTVLFPYYSHLAEGRIIYAFLFR